MVKQATGTGKTVEEAMEAAKIMLGIKDGDDFEIIETVQPQKKTFGLFGGSPAKVTLAFGKEDEPVEEKPRRPLPKKEKTEKKPEKKAEKPVETKAEPVETKTEPVVTVKTTDDEKTAIENGSEEYKGIEGTVNYLVAVLEKMGVSEIETKAFKTVDGYEIAFDGKGLGVAIGRKGDTLDSLQHLCSLVANHEHKDYIRVTLNPGGYREKRRSTLIDQAVKYANKAKEKELNYTLEPMNAYERRIVHNAVQTVYGVLSWSIGEGDNRRVVIGTSKDNRTLRSSNRSNDRRNGRGGRVGRGGRGGNRERRPSYDQTPTREPRKDSDSLPLYGIIK